MSALPRGWATALLGEVAATSLGKMLDSKRNTGENPVPYLRNINVRWGAFDLRELLTMDIRPDELDRVLARRGDVIACEGGEPGRAAVWTHDDPVAIQKALHRITPHAGIDPDFLALLLRHRAISGELDRLFTGTTIKHLPQEKLRLVDVPVPPTAEQERIVTAIEEAFSLLDAGEAGLRAIRTRLKRLRDSVLADAVTGHLVPQDPTDTPASALLPDGGRGAEAATASGLPDGWCWTTLGALLSDIEAGKSYSAGGRPAAADEMGVIKVSAMTWGRFRSDENKVLPPGARIDPRWVVRAGDILLSRANTSEHVGACVLVPRDHSNLILSDKSLRLIPVHGVQGAWLVACLRSRSVREQIQRLATGTKDSMRNISQEKLRSLRLALPPPEEQARIVAEVERQFSFIEAAERAVDAALVRSAGLRRSVLKAAFEGRLVPQDPTDESASVLLERVRQLAPASKKGRRGYIDI